MAIDTSIYGNIRPFTMGDPYESAGRALALQSAKRQFTMQDDIAQAGAETGGDPEKMAQALMLRGHYEPAIKLRQQAASLRKDQVGVVETEQKRLLSLAPSIRDALARVNDDAGLSQYRQTLLNLANSFQTPELQRQMLQGVQQLPTSFDQKWKQQQLLTADQVIAKTTPKVQLTDTGGSLTPMNLNPDAGPVGPLPGAQSINKTVPPAGPTELARLQAELAALPAGDPRIAQYDRVLASYKAGRGDTNVQVNTGPMTPGKAGGNKVDEDLLGVTRGLMQLDAIQTQFKPEFQQYMDKAAYTALSVKEKAGFQLTNKQKKDLTEFSAYRRNAVNSLNEYIKSITGAAMSEPEAKRILSGMPKPGDGIFDGDSPTEFKSKLDDAIQKTKMAVARLAYIKRNGMSLEDGQGNPVVPLERMPQLINSRGREVEDELKKTGVTGQALQRAVRRQLGVEFGLVSD